MEQSTCVALERRGPVAWITLQRPAALNALSPEMLDALEHALLSLERDASVRVLVVTGSGRAFCAGADLKAARERGDAAAAAFLDGSRRLVDRVACFPKPVLALVNGIAVAFGLELLLACDVAIAADSARIGDGHANFALLPGAGGSVRLPRRIGAMRAKYMMFTAELQPAARLVEWGLLLEAVPADTLHARGTALADQLASKSPLGIARMKQLVDDGVCQPPDIALRNEQLMSALHFHAADRREGLAAFAEKRPPVFTGS